MVRSSRNKIGKKRYIRISIFYLL